MPTMGIEVYLYRAADRIDGLLDPAGGYFDAAGDFDRLLPTDAVAFPILSQLGPYDDLQLDHTSMLELIHEIHCLLPSARPGREQRGLARLRTLAEQCAENTDSTMTFMGD
jgi:hypothetical protein